MVRGGCVGEGVGEGAVRRGSVVGVAAGKVDGSGVTETAVGLASTVGGVTTTKGWEEISAVSTAGVLRQPAMNSVAIITNTSQICFSGIGNVLLTTTGDIMPHILPVEHQLDVNKADLRPMQENTYAEKGSFWRWLGLFWVVPLDNVFFEIAL